MRAAFAPGRVNLIGDHTDYTGGLVLPMAIQLGTTVSFDASGDRILLRSGAEREPADLPLRIRNPRSVTPSWARYVAGIIAEIKPASGGTGSITTTLPVGEGLASSAALEVALAMALGYAGSPEDLAVACQRAERRAVGVPCGIMDQLASLSGIDGHALLIDCSANSVQPVRLPRNCEVVAIPTGEQHSLARSRYAERTKECEKAEAFVGPLRSAALVSVEAIPDPVLRRRARHVVSENQRVIDFAGSLRLGNLSEAGRLMVESHRSLRDDFEVSTPALDDLVARLMKIPGVHGARLTGAGFGGSVVALTRPGVLDEGRVLKPSGGARLL
ncbi:MAG TPA: galactokinase family protein [Acidimicrobiales bacterium]|nr:galactokinase family protein [Acidimicrobiales bacterium]